MLNSLSIKNFALIDDIELSLEDELTIITGETGTGKSILLGALSLLLGKRADLNSIKNTKNKCVIEGSFAIEAYQLKTLFDARGLDYEPQSIVRREILPSGKSRAFVNDTPVKLKQLQALGPNLVDIHSQHETRFVGNTAYQYQVIDALADHKKCLNNYQNAHQNYKKLIKKLDRFQKEQGEAQKSYDYDLFLYEELAEAELKEGMQVDLEERYEQLSHVEELKENLSASLHQLQQEDIGTIDGLQTIKNRLNKIENFGKTYRTLSERMASVLIETEDLAMEIEGLFELIDDDPNALQTVNDKLQNIYRLEKKHQVGSVAELLTVQKELKAKLAAINRREQTTEQLENEIKTAKNNTEKWAKILFKNRQNALPNFVKSVESLLERLGMPDARLKITLDKTSAFNTHGQDVMHWLFSANKGGRFQELKNSASGGELSRITLSIKSILAEYNKLPTIVFDEIDTGVSGEIAQKMGDIMARMSKSMQVISITHLPQIAAKGNHHFKVFKQTENNNTHTGIVMLDQKERIEELAEMLGGKERSDSAMAHAKALLT